MANEPVFQLQFGQGDDPDIKFQCVLKGGANELAIVFLADPRQKAVEVARCVDWLHDAGVSVFVTSIRHQVTKSEHWKETIFSELADVMPRATHVLLCTFLEDETSLSVMDLETKTISKLTDDIGVLEDLVQQDTLSENASRLTDRNRAFLMDQMPNLNTGFLF